MYPLLPESYSATGIPFDIPAPVKGWNARDSIAQMGPLDAIQLDNWFPGTTTVDLRLGRGEIATVPSGETIETLMAVALASGAYIRFAASENGIYNITAGGAIAAVSSAATNGQWESVQINVDGVSYLWCCCGDGTNLSRIYNGTTAAWTSLNGTSTPALTGLNSENVAYVSLWKYRLILTEVNSLKFYYGALNSVGGAFTAFDLGQVFRRGGYLVATANWTVDAGDGADDMFVAVSSEGEVAVYSGTDPSNVSTFALIGVYDIGKPIGRRCFIKLAGDLGLLTEQGLWPLSKALLSSTVDKRVALTDKIQSVFNSYATTYGTVFGWQPVLLPKGPALIVNVPISTTVSYQFVMNLITGAWCRFTDWSSSCMMVVDGKLYTALGNSVQEAWTGESDNDSAITAIATSAYTYGPARARGKKVNLVRPTLQVSSHVNLSVRILNGFQSPPDMAPSASFPTEGALWDTAVFDTDAFVGAQSPQRGWKAVKHTPGRAFALQLGIQARDISVSWSQTDFIAEKAQPSLL